MLCFHWTSSLVHQALHTAGVVDKYHMIQMMKKCHHLPVLELVFYPSKAYQGHFLVLVGKINMFFLEKFR